jgi:serine/threonine protein kinase
MMALPFETILNYRLLEELGGGTFGRVYRAEHIYLTERIVAIKLLQPIHQKHEKQDFLREASILALLKHPHILPILETGIQDDRPYLITEYAPGGSLRDRLKRPNPQPQCLPFDESMRILEQIAQALQAAHEKRVVHRDLKPENILFQSDNHILLADFGISVILGTKSIQTENIVGTPPYMAPEQFKGHVSKESDQYALGCIAYELFTGQRPFSAPDFYSMTFKHMQEEPPPPMQFNPNLPEPISQAVLKALAKERHQRFPDVMDFATTLKLGFANDYISKGLAFYKQQQFTEALDAYQQVLRFSCCRPEPQEYKKETLDTFQQTTFTAYTGQYVALQHLKRYEEALKACEQALQIRTKDWITHYNKGLILDDMQRYQDALNAYSSAILLNPQATNAYNNQGIVYRKLGQHQDALTAYERAIQVQPNSTTAHYNKGQVLYYLQRYEDALQAYQEAIRYNPNDARAYHQQGVILYILKRYQEALQAYEKAIRLNPQYATAYYNQGITLKMLGRDTEAQQAETMAQHLQEK